MHIRDFQRMMYRLYYHKDSRRGTEGTYDWLVDEVEELGDALHQGNKEELEKEFADVFAWLASLANVVSVDLERITLLKYNNKCPKCGCLPCECSL